MIYENDEPNDVDTLVYAEDLSRNGTYWNGSLIGQGNGGYLLSDGDVLKLTRNNYLVFTGNPDSPDKSAFDLTQECEMAVCSVGWTPRKKTDSFSDSGMTTL